MPKAKSAKTVRIEQIRELLSNPDVNHSRKYVEDALLTIYSYQTAEEQHSGSTYRDNGVGFSGADAEILSSFAKQLQRQGYHLSPKQFAIAQRKMVKYARQLAEVWQPGTAA